MGRAPCCIKDSVKKGPWSPEEDAILKAYIEKHGTGGNWIAFPQKAGLKRCGKSCRLRWLNYLRPDIRHGAFTEEEDIIILSLYKSMGSRWSVIASHLPGRTDNDIKNYWNTKLKKKLIAAQLLPQSAPAAASYISPPLLPHAVKQEEAPPSGYGYSAPDPQGLYWELDGIAEKLDFSGSSSSSSSYSNWGLDGAVGASSDDWFLSGLLGGFGSEEVVEDAYPPASASLLSSSLCRGFRHT